MKTKLFLINIMLLLNSYSLSYAQTYNIDAYFFPNKERKDVKMITEKKFSGWKTISLFNKEGFLMQRINYKKEKKRADYRYEYLITDTLVQITEKDFLNNIGSFLLYKYYFNRQGHCYKYEGYSSQDLDVPFVIGNNFMYKDGLLQSYEHSIYTNEKEYIISNKVNYIYNDKGQEIQKQGCRTNDTTYYNSVYNQKEQLIDYIIKSNNKASAFTGVICWSSTKMNMVQYRYENFDKKENWRKSYFITEKGKRFRSKRKIEYW
jgi:hypothetical protein